MGAIDTSAAVLAADLWLQHMAFEMLMAGTTTCADMSLHGEWVAKAAEASGIHAQISVPVSDDHNVWTRRPQRALDRALDMHDTDAITHELVSRSVCLICQKSIMQPWSKSPHTPLS